MLFRTSAVLALGAMSVAASIRSTIHSRSSSSLQPNPAVAALAPRQTTISADDIPDACKDQCSSLVEIAEKCQGGDRDECLQICVQDSYTEFVGCMQCEIDELGYTYSESDARLVDQAMGQLPALCRRVGRQITLVPLNLTTSDNPTNPSTTGNAGTPVLDTKHSFSIVGAVAVIGAVGSALL